MTIAIGDCISLPGSPPRKASGIRASADVNAVMTIGKTRSRAPIKILSDKECLQQVKNYIWI